jgi:hypothetical protein
LPCGNRMKTVDLTILRMGIVFPSEGISVPSCRDHRPKICSLGFGLSKWLIYTCRPT